MNPRGSAAGELFIGVDLGTGGVRALAVSAAGEVVAGSAVSLEAARVADAEGLHEQAPQGWWEATCQALGELMGELKAAGIRAETLRALAVDGTSGTLACLDETGRPLRAAIMYNDARAGEEAEGLNERAGDFCDKLGYRFAASFALAKILWVQRREPEVFAQTARFLHQADFVQGCLSGDFSLSDYSNALKTGYDLIAEEWPAWIDQFEGVRERLPRVVAPGTRVGEVGATASARTGLPEGLAVVAGATDGTAGCVASGVRRPGDYNTTLGTTLVFKGISRKPGRHPEELVYSHKLPGGLWLPGAASNTGGDGDERVQGVRYPGPRRRRAGFLPVPELGTDPGREGGARGSLPGRGRRAPVHASLPRGPDQGTVPGGSAGDRPGHGTHADGLLCQAPPQSAGLHHRHGFPQPARDQRAEVDGGRPAS